MRCPKQSQTKYTYLLKGTDIGILFMPLVE